MGQSGLMSEFQANKTLFTSLKLAEVVLWPHAHMCTHMYINSHIHIIKVNLRQSLDCQLRGFSRKMLRLPEQ